MEKQSPSVREVEEARMRLAGRAAQDGEAEDGERQGSNRNGDGEAEKLRTENGEAKN